MGDMTGDGSAASTYLLRQVRVLDPVTHCDRIADVLIADNKIRAIETALTSLPEGIDAAAVNEVRRPGAILGPGLVEFYSHASDPGFESRETVDTLARSALLGGFTRLMLLPTTQPVIDHKAGLMQLRARFSEQCPGLKVGVWGGLTAGLLGRQLSDLGELATAGAVGFTNAGALPNEMLYPALEYGQALNKPIGISLCRSPRPAREGAAALRLGLPSASAADETAVLAALLEQLDTIPASVHVMQLSTARGVALVAEAKTRGLPVTASTTWLHMLKDTTHLDTYNPNLRIHPPLGNPRDREALVHGVATGTIDGIAIEHCPHTYEEKTVPFAESPPGVIGLQMALPLLWNQLVEAGRLSALELWRALSTHPAQCLQQPPPSLALHQDAELVLFDPTERWEATPQALASLSHNTPWLYQPVPGRVVELWLPTDSATAGPPQGS